jgi:hypothetical protein
MTESEFDPTLEDARRKAAWRAHLEASAAASAEVEAHRATSARLRASQRGLYDMTPQELAADVAARTACVGDDYGGRDLVAQGGTFDWRDVSDSPAPVSHDMRWIDRPGQRATGESPLLRHMRGQS